MAQLTRQSLIGVAMRLYGSFAGKAAGETIAALASLENLVVAGPRLADCLCVVPHLDSLSVSAPRLDSLEILP